MPKVILTLIADEDPNEEMKKIVIVIISIYSKSLLHW